MTARGLRNNNPGNLRRSKDPWQGLTKQQPDREFFTFTSPAFGIRALAVTLITYQDKHGCRTVSDFISRWAPASENNTTAYVNAVAMEMGRSVGSIIDVHDRATLLPMVKAIIRHENGQQPYADAQIDEGLSMAGVVAPPPTSATVEVAKDPKVALTGIAALLASLREVFGEASDIWGTYGKWGLVAIAVAAGGYFVWQALSKRWSRG